MPHTYANTGAAVGAVRVLLRLEGAALFAAATTAYTFLESSWVTYGFFFLVPDLCFAGYLLGPRTGAIVYNAVHTSALPLLVGIGAVLLQQTMISAVACVWLAHIGLDRAIGFGLKYPTAFADTHLGRL